MNSASAPGRVVMVVANRIDGDSRVQKSAQSMAEAGWEVHLIGLSVSGKQEHYRHGDVEYHKIPVPKMDPPKSLRRRLAALRYPLAYGDTARVKHGDTRIKVERIELEAIDDERGRGGRDGLLRPPRLVRRLGRKAQRFWIGRRISQTRGRDRAAARDDGRLDRLERRWWTLMLGDRVWRRLDTDAVRIELALQPEILRLEPDLIHAHDMHPIGICARAAARMRRSGKDVKLLYDAHEFVPGCDTLPADRFESLVRYERRYLPSADAIVTVSQPLAELLREHHGLDRTPAVVLNAPLTPDFSRPDPGDIRSACELGEETPLGVYSGWAAPERKIEWIIEAAARIPGFHVAFLVNRPNHPYVKSLIALGEELDVADRLHFRGYVDYADLPRFLSTADVGIHPMQAGPINHEIALPNKFFEYSHAQLPLVVSDVKTLSEEVRRLGNGEVFASGDIDSLVVAIEKVLANPQAYRDAYRDPDVLAGYTWERQVHTYVELYEELIGRAGALRA